MNLLGLVVPWWGRWAALAALVVAAAAFGAAKMHAHDSVRYDALAGQFAAFKEGVRQAGELAARQARDQTAADKLRKEQADAENLKTVAALTARVAELRHDRDARGSGVPAAPPGAPRPDLVCFDRAEYQRAYGALVAELRGQSDEGTAATVDLDTAKRWASP